MIYTLIAFLAATSISGHVITTGKFENRLSSPETKVDLGQAQIEVENKLAKGKLIEIPAEVQSTIQTPPKLEEIDTQKLPVESAPEELRTQPTKQSIKPAVQSQSQTITDVHADSPYLGYATPYLYGKPHHSVLPIQLQADKAEFNVANLSPLPVDYLNLLTPAQIQAYSSKFNIPNLQSYVEQKKFATPLYFVPKYVSRVEPFPAYTTPVSTYSPYGIGSNLASPQLNFKINELANFGQSGKF